MRRDGGERCAWDGLAVEPIYRVRIVEPGGDSYSFCSPECAEHWLHRDQRDPIDVLVTDEAGGDEVDAASASFVRSTVATNAVTGNRLHAFRRTEDALRHIEAAGGRLLQGPQRPFTELTDSHSRN